MAEIDGESIAAKPQIIFALVVQLCALCALIRRRKWRTAYQFADRLDQLVAELPKASA
jgi:hypothetical protein